MEDMQHKELDSYLEITTEAKQKPCRLRIMIAISSDDKNTSGHESGKNRSHEQRPLLVNARLHPDFSQSLAS
jgi:hypothetical protein